MKHYQKYQSFPKGILFYNENPIELKLNNVVNFNKLHKFYLKDYIFQHLSQA